MANFNMTVDTDEMAQALHGVSVNVNTVTAAVAGMQTAVIAAETAAANRICQHVDQGFFALIRSQITQKMVRCRSEVDSRYLELRQQSQALAGFKARMERDFQMIAQRYTRLFQSIDQSLRGRVFELDRPAAQLVNRESARLSLRMDALQARPSVHQWESVHIAQLMAVSQAKQSAWRVLNGMRGFLHESAQQSSLVKSMLSESTMPTADTRYIPVLLIESDTVGVTGTKWEASVAPGIPTPGTAKIHAGAHMLAFANAATLRWRPLRVEEKQRVTTAFNRQLDEVTDTRVKTHMARLFSESGWATTGGGAA